MIYLDNNSIGAEGCKYLSEAKWDNLAQLYIGIIIVYLDNNNIGAEGCKHLSNAKWS